MDVQVLGSWLTQKKKGQMELSSATWESQVTPGSPLLLDLGDSINRRINILLLNLLSIYPLSFT